MTNTSSHQTTSADSARHTEMTHRGNTTVEDPDVHPATRSDYNDAAEIVAALDEQEIRDPLDESNCCDGGDHGFRTYKTDLPVIRSEDITPGRLIYRPTTSPLTVFEIDSEPYVNEYGFRRVDVKAHSRSHAGDGAEIRTQERAVFQAAIVNEMTFLQATSVQETLTGATVKTGGRSA